MQNRIYCFSANLEHRCSAKHHNKVVATGVVAHDAPVKENSQRGHESDCPEGDNAQTGQPVCCQEEQGCGLQSEEDFHTELDPSDNDGIIVSLIAFAKEKDLEVEMSFANTRKTLKMRSRTTRKRRRSFGKWQMQLTPY
jgi:hypothetical protein